MQNVHTIQWQPFLVVPTAEGLPFPRPLKAVDLAGLGDRMRIAAFAEKQAYHAFLWGAEIFENQAPKDLIEAWRTLAIQELNHMNLILARMQELGIAVDERPVTDVLWTALTSCKTAKEFCLLMADAESRGRRAGERLAEKLKETDLKTAEIFEFIAAEEREHIALAERFYPA